MYPAELQLHVCCGRMRPTAEQTVGRARLKEDSVADKPTVALGIDIGGSGIKGAPVDLVTSEFLADRVKIATPAKSTPEAVAEIVGQIAKQFLATLPPDAPIGVTIPGIVRHGVVKSAANIDKSWMNCDGEKLFSKALGRHVHLVNDADAAGVAELRYGVFSRLKLSLLPYLMRAGRQAHESGLPVMRPMP